MRREYFYIGLIVLLIGAGFFGGGYYRKENRELKQENEVLAEASAMLLKENKKLSEQISERDTFIKTTTLAYDSLKSNLTVVSAKIATTFPRHSAVLTAGIDSQIIFLTKYISQADSLRN